MRSTAPSSARSCVARDVEPHSEAGAGVAARVGAHPGFAAGGPLSRRDVTTGSAAGLTRCDLRPAERRAAQDPALVLAPRVINARRELSDVLEQRRHTQFAAHRFPGTEWFAVHHALLEHIAELAAGVDDPWREYERWVLRRTALSRS